MRIAPGSNTVVIITIIQWCLRNRILWLARVMILIIQRCFERAKILLVLRQLRQNLLLNPLNFIVIVRLIK